MAIQPDLLLPEHFPVDFGSYRLMGLLGEGGMARVFRAELIGEEGFRKPTAVKVIHAAVAARGEALRRSLINEARTGGLLHHPNIVDTYNFGEVDGLPYIAMEYVRGVGLDEAIGEHGALPPQLALEIGAQIAAGLDHAHCLEVAGVSAALVHRDLKPSNIIISRDGLVKVMDFGIAKATTNAYDTTQTGMTKGTPAYMSPEQASGGDLDGRSDLFALGAILYEMATGQRFFQGDTLVSLLLKVISVETQIHDPARMDPVEAAVPGLAAVVRRCLRKEPADRWADAAALEHALRLLQRELPPGPPLRGFARSFVLSGAGAGLETPMTPMTPAQVPPAPTPITRPQSPALAAAPAVAATVAMTAAPKVAATRVQVPVEREKQRKALPAWLPLVAGFLGTLLLVGGVGLFLWPSANHAPAPAPVAQIVAPPDAPTDPVETPPDPVETPTGSVAPARPEATAAATPSPAASPTPAPRPEPSTPAPRAVEAATPAPAIRAAKPRELSFGVRSAVADEAGRDGDDTMIVKFSARIDAGSPDTDVTVYFNPPKAKWVERKMRFAGGDRWEVNIDFPKKSVGKTYWYIVAQAPNGERTFWRSEDKPDKLRLRWD